MRDGRSWACADGPIDNFPMPTAARTAKTGLIAGLALGLGQDAVSLMRGRRLAYVDFLTGRPWGEKYGSDKMAT